MTTNEYPKTCTRQEAIDCVKAGGTASAKGKCELAAHWRVLVEVHGSVTHPNFTSGDSFPNLQSDEHWNYRIDVPAPVSQPDTYSTAEAIAELYKHKPGEVEFTGQRADGALTMNIDGYGDLFVENEFEDLLDFIPNIRWTRKVNNPPLVTGSTTVEAGDHLNSFAGPFAALFGKVNRMRESWPGKIRVTYTVEAVE